MAGTSVAVPATSSAHGGGDSASSSSFDFRFSSLRISTIADRLAFSARSHGTIEAREFCQMCFSLSRDIDSAILNQVIPPKAPELPSILKQVCKRNYEPFLQAAVMVLMISVKSACQSGWFAEKDSEDLCHLANEISGNFCSAADFRGEPCGSESIISTIMTRFFPTMKMGRILAFLEAKPGYGAFVDDFHVSNNVEFSPEEKIRLLVAQTDNMETSSCLVSPPQVNFLLNGSGVANRTNVFMDTGPQIPTVVSDMLKYGSNLLQAVGDFNGNYIIVVAYMSMISIPDAATQLTLQNFQQPAPAPEDPESDIIVGASRISLNCPISFKGIKTPVKGHSCKHLQCFDYDNFVDINSRRPSWRCPHCNQSVCFTDIRIDQSIAKVLKEVGENITDVIISSDGSWNAEVETNAHNDETAPDKFPGSAAGEAVMPCSSGISNGPEDILDLTELDDVMDEADVDEKTHQTNNTKNPSTVNHTSHELSDFWSRVFFSTYGLGPYCSTSNPQMSGFSENALNFIPPPVQSDAVTPASVMQGGQWYQHGSSATTQSMVTGIPIAYQDALAFASQQRPRNSIKYMNYNVPSATSQGTNILQEPRLPSVPPLSSIGLPGLQFPGQTPDPLTTEPLSSTQLGILSQRASHIATQSQGLTRPSASNFSQSSQITRPVQMSTGGDQSRNMSVPVPVDSQSDQEWRPAGRMRGSLSGQAYAEALQRYVVNPTLQAQHSRPATSAGANISPHLQSIIANSARHASAMLNHSSAG